jgi:hypothetical protein
MAFFAALLRLCRDWCRANFQQQGIRVMAEATATTMKSKTKAALGEFETPKFEMPKVDVPAAFREFAEKGVAQAKEGYEKIKAAAEESTAVLEDTYAPASQLTLFVTRAA